MNHVMLLLFAIPVVSFFAIALYQVIDETFKKKFVLERRAGSAADRAPGGPEQRRRFSDTVPAGTLRTADHADDTTLIIGTFTYSGTGWKTSGDALLANTAADQARKRREAGREELADEYNRAGPGRWAA